MFGRLTLALLAGLSWINILQAQSIETDTHFPRADQPFTFTIDVTGTSLEGYEGDVYLWTWLEQGDQSFDAPTNVDPATDAQQAAKMTRSDTNPNAYSFTITPTAFFNQPAAGINLMGLKLKSKSWSDGKQSDRDQFIKIFQTGFQFKILNPDQQVVVSDENTSISIKGVASAIADSIVIRANSVLIEKFSGISEVNTTINSGLPGSKEVILSAYLDQVVKSDTLLLLVFGESVQEPLPAGIVEGINYLNDTEVILAIKAPGKKILYALGDFNDWTKYDETYAMKLDESKEIFWVKVSDLIPGQEYRFQYLVDGKIVVADPYADKILDPDDQWIPESIYPDLIEYPEPALSDTWYLNRVAVLQTAQPGFDWQVPDFQAPVPEELVIYELLIRDFFAENDRSFQSLIDTLNYLENLGVNAIQLMPITEFNGNNSWGYNPTFMFAVDKAYGPKNDLKRFIDAAHQRGIAVILDMVLNHQDFPNPFLVMHNLDDTPNENPYSNPVARHPFNVFIDLNHESAYTQDYVDTVNHYWLNEYKFDGYRYDLSKGFTQKNTGDDVAAWTAYDASRVALLKRMADQVWSHSPDAYIILEHFGDDQEEKELSDYGMMLWGNMNHLYSDANMARNANLSRTYFQNRGWNNNLLVSYLESHDEERVMYRTLNNGLSNGAYDTKNLDVALERLKMSHAFLLLVPGPRMIWQFGELGYDISINQCEDGSLNSNCNIAPKPLKWEYYQQENRKMVYDVIAELNQLRQTEAFKNGAFNWQSFERVKWIKIEHESQDMLVIGNFNTFSESYTFAEGGTWYDYFTGSELKIPAGGFEYDLEPGQFHIFVSEPPSDVPVDLVPWTIPVITSLENDLGSGFQLFPNPVKDYLTIKLMDHFAGDIALRDITGKQIAAADYRLIRATNQVKVDMSRMSNGLYLLEVMGDKKRSIYKIIKR